MTKTALCKDLRIGWRTLSRLTRWGLIVYQPDGSIDERKTFQKLLDGWEPPEKWWDKPVGRFGRRLRAEWLLDDYPPAEPLYVPLDHAPVGG